MRPSNTSNTDGESATQSLEARQRSLETAIFSQVGTNIGKPLINFLIEQNLLGENVSFDQSRPQQLRFLASVIEDDKSLQLALGKLSPSHPFQLSRDKDYFVLSLSYQQNPNYKPPMPKTEGLMTPDEFMMLYKNEPLETLSKLEYGDITIDGNFQPEHNSAQFLPAEGETFYGVPPLIQAAFWGSGSAVQSLLKSHADPLSLISGAFDESVEWRCDYGRLQSGHKLVNNPILQAAESSHIDVAKAIFNHIRENVILSETACDNYDRTLLMFAAMVGDTTAIRQILDSNRNNIKYLTAKDDLGSCALVYALKLGHLESAKLILNALEHASADIQVILSKLFYEFKPISALILSAHDAELFQFLVAKGANVFQRSDSGLSVLDAVVKSDNIDSVQLILSKIKEGNREDARQKMLNKALFWTVKKHHLSETKLDILNLLVEMGADINARNAQGISLLGLAVVAALSPSSDVIGVKMIEAILTYTKQGLDECLLNENGGLGMLSPLMLVTTYSQASPHSNLLKLLLDAGADVRVKDKYGKNALVHTARRHAMQGRQDQKILAYEFGKQILEAMNAAEETAPSSPDTDQGLETALQLAADRNYAKLVKLLLEAGADVYAEIADDYRDVKTVLAHLKHKNTYSSPWNNRSIEAEKVIKQWISTHPRDPDRVKAPIEMAQEKSRLEQLERVKKKKIRLRKKRSLREKSEEKEDAQDASACKKSSALFSGVDQGADLGGQADAEASSVPSASASSAFPSCSIN